MSALPRPPVKDASTEQANIVAAISVRHGDHLAAVLDAVHHQVYEPQSVVVVGGGDDARTAAGNHDVRWAADLRSMLDDLDRATTHIWLVHDDARPRPDALQALVSESIRVDASVAGSKLLNSEHPEVLESVGGATDVFGMPYTGLEVGEVDQEQYDVVRDVSFIPGASVLVRRDLLRGLGGPDALLPPLEAGIDFAQRARTAGGRVVVVPSSEVLHDPNCGADDPPWKSRAGRIRSSLKVYSALTLIWLIPVGAVLDLLDGIVRIVIGPRLSLIDAVRSWVWNLVRLPSTLAARRVVKRSRQVDDAELFRYQVRGSSVLRKLGDDVTEAVRGPAMSEGAFTLSDLMARGRQVWQQPGVIIGAIGLALIALAGRAIIIGRLPATGYALHLPDAVLETLKTYAGGWNPAGLGTARPLPPSVGGAAAVQLLLFGRAGLAEMVLTVGGAFVTFIGTSRLMRLLGVGSGGRFIAGVVAFSGPATLAMTDAGLWPGLPALAAMPFALASFLRPWPGGWLARIGRVAADTLPVAILAMFAPLASIVPLAATILWFAIGTDRHWTAVGRAGLATVVSLPVLAPWIVFIDSTYLIEAGRPYFWAPAAWVVVAFAVAVLVPLFLGSQRTAAVTAWGGLLAGLGAVAARTAEVGGGFEPSVAGLATAAVGLAIVAGSAIDAIRQLGSHRVWRRVSVVPGVVAGIALAATFFFVLADGALGFGQDRFSEPLEFTTARQAEHGTDRVLIIGTADNLPGDARMAGDFSYRLFQAPEPTLLDARLHPAQGGDLALRETLQELTGIKSLRPGEQLAQFGIRWVVFTEPSPFEEAFASKLDMKPLPLTEFEAVYENLVASPVASEIDGDAWVRTTGGFEGSRSEGRVRIAMNADSGWRPEPASVGWAATVSASEGRAWYESNGEKALYAWVAAFLLVGLGGLAIIGRRAKQ
ncbi:MAG: hypothetical protein P1T08_09185 [Acidimicrobiia bacterium]|nr:hypothetical protein [Acidimicrobiia bacterium]